MADAPTVWGMMVIFERRTPRLIELVSPPSQDMLPSVDSSPRHTKSQTKCYPAF
jgi:hypothetical protein